MRQTIPALALLLAGCYRAGTPTPPADAGPAAPDAACVFRWPCVGEGPDAICPEPDLVEGIPVPCAP